MRNSILICPELLIGEFFIIINKYDDALLEFGQKLVTFSNLEIVKEVSITEKNPHGLWLAVGVSAEMLIALPFWHDEFIHFSGKTKTYSVKIWKLFYEISLI